MNKEQYFFEKDVGSEQLELFLEDPELRERFERVKYDISVLGGGMSEREAWQLGHDLTKNWFSVRTGGYNIGTMKGALEGADKAFEEMKQDPANRETMTLFCPVIKGVTAEKITPSFGVAKGKNIKVEAKEGKYGLYLRLGELIEGSKLCIVLPGEEGTELEAMADLNFDKKLKALFGLPTKPIIFVGNAFDDLLEKFRETINASNNVYKVENVQEATDLVKKIFDKEYSLKNKSGAEKVESIEKALQEKLLRFE